MTDDGLPEPGLLTRRLALRPVLATDLPRLYEISLSPRTIHTWRYAGAPPTYEEFIRTFEQGVHLQLVITSRETDQPVGLIATYNASLRHGHAYLYVIVESELEGSGIGIEATFAFLYYCFSVWPWHKIYFEALDDNWKKMSSGLGRGLFVEEGRLRDHSYVMGRRVDYHIAAFYPEVLRENKFVRRMLKHVLVADTRPSIVKASGLRQVRQAGPAGGPIPSQSNATGSVRMGR